MLAKELQSARGRSKFAATQQREAIPGGAAFGRQTCGSASVFEGSREPFVGRSVCAKVEDLRGQSVYFISRSAVARVALVRCEMFAYRVDVARERGTELWVPRVVEEVVR